LTLSCDTQRLSESSWSIETSEDFLAPPYLTAPPKRLV